jgi:hypothetical protein
MRFHTLPVSSHAAVAIRTFEPADVPVWFAYLSQPEVFEHTSWNVQDADELMHYADGAALPPRSAAC